MSSMLREMLEAKWRRVEQVQRFYGISRRAADAMIDMDCTTVGKLQALLASGTDARQWRGVGPGTEAELYELAGLPVPARHRHKCPKCGHGWD